MAGKTFHIIYTLAMRDKIALTNSEAVTEDAGECSGCCCQGGDNASQQSGRWHATQNRHLRKICARRRRGVFGLVLKRR